MLGAKCRVFVRSVWSRQICLRSFARKAMVNNKQADFSNTFGDLANRGNSEQKFNLVSQRMKQKARYDATSDVASNAPEQYEEDFKLLEDEKEDSTIFQPFNFRHKPHWYAKMCRKLAGEGKIPECVAMLEERMLKEDKVAPCNYNFNLVISILAQKGFTNKAFELYKKMRSYGLEPTTHTFTSLFNACANCPHPKIGLEKAKTLRENLSARSYVLNRLQYHSMIKAFARNGDLPTAFEIVDEMLSNRIVPDVSTFSHLMIACINDKEAGFKLVVEVWRKMLRRKILPDVKAYNLLLRACRECDVGDLQSAKEMLRLDSGVSSANIIEASEKKDFFDNRDAKMEKPVTFDEFIESTESSLIGEKISETASSTSKKMNENLLESVDEQSSHLPSVIQTNEVSLLPNLTERSWSGAPIPFKGNILNPKFECPAGLINLSTDITISAADRFSLLGGINGFLHMMKRHSLTPDIRIFTQFLDLIPNSTQPEEVVMSKLATAIRPDTDFFNLIIKRRCLRREFDSALEIIARMRTYALQPNIMTFGVLACGCNSRVRGAQLLQNMKTLGMTPNIVILTSLMTNSLNSCDPLYTIDVLKEFKQIPLQPNERFLMTIDKRIAEVHGTLVKAETSRELPDFYRSSYFRNGFRQLKRFYLTWLKEMKFSPPTDPWVELERSVDSNDLKTEKEKEWLVVKPRI